MRSPLGCRELLDKLAESPKDSTLREQAARALLAEGRTRDAIELLTSALRNVTAHEGQRLPCLCAKCLDPEQVEATVKPFAFYREFAVAKGRVLFYWVPRELTRRRAGIRHSVQDALYDRLKPRRLRSRP
jgi:hypothetical protein